MTGIKNTEKNKDWRGWQEIGTLVGRDAKWCKRCGKQYGGC